MAEIRGMVADVAGLLAVAARSFLGTLLVMVCWGLALAAVSYWLLSGRHSVYGLIAAVVALIECGVVGVILAGKRAVLMALVHGLQKYQLASAMVRLIFGRLMGVSAEEPHGERGGWVTQTVERLPLAQAEHRLNQILRGMMDEPSADVGVTGWLRRRVRSRLLSAVRKYTLARFREEDARYGGVDCVKIQDDLGGRIDGHLAGKLRRTINGWTAAVLLGLPFQIVVTDYIVLALLK